MNPLALALDAIDLLDRIAQRAMMTRADHVAAQQAAACLRAAVQVPAGPSAVEHEGGNGQQAPKPET